MSRVMANALFLFNVPLFLNVSFISFYLIERKKDQKENILTINQARDSRHPTFGKKINFSLKNLNNLFF